LKSLPKLNNLDFRKVKDDILLVHQKKPPFYFSCCDGLIILPKLGRNTKTVILDLNIEPKLIIQINEYYGPISDYVCTHAHMDHIAHVHQWESLGANIYAPIPEFPYLLNLENFYKGFKFDEILDFSIIQKFAEANGYHSCNRVNPFKPGEKLEFDNLTIETISFSGHSKAHTGFYLPEAKVLHISCLGFDQPEIGIDGFGPWYGFRECSIEQYFKDIDYAEELFIKRAEYLTSSHSYIVKSPDTNPFDYMRGKIQDKQEIVESRMKSLNLSLQKEEMIEKLLELDIFFPKKKMKDFMLDIYSLWEYWIIRKHIERSQIFLRE
jgi:hydroxyacylglutathione hydrolase